MSSSIRDEFLNRFSGKSKKQALNALNAFDSFIKIKYFSNEDNFLVKCKFGDEQNKYLVLDDLVQFWIHVSMSPATIKNYFSFIRAYLRRHGIKTHSDDIHDYIKFPKKIKEQRSPLDKSLIQKILSVSSPKYRALFLFCASSGMRIGEVLSCKVSWLDMNFHVKHGLVLINIPALETKEQAERYAFISNEAYLALKPYLATKLSPTDFVFDLSYGAAAEYVQSIRNKISFNDKYASGFHKLTLHSFRSFTRTTLSDKCGLEFALYILGQEGYLSSYYRKSPEKACELYKLAEPDLTISDTFINMSGEKVVA